MEYLGVDRRPRPRWVRFVVGALLAVLALAAVLAWWTEHQRASATEALAAGFTQAAQRADRGEVEVRTMLAYVAPAVWRWDLPDQTRADLWAVVEDAAADVAVDLDAIRTEVSDVRILPWQAEQAAAQAEVLALIDGQYARFDGMAADATDADLILAGGPLPTGAAMTALRAAGADLAPPR
jgi:hypothetical protein